MSRALFCKIKLLLLDFLEVFELLKITFVFLLKFKNSFYCNSPQAVAREKLDKMREANESKTRKELEMTIADLKVSSVSVVTLRSKGGNAKAVKRVSRCNGGKTCNRWLRRKNMKFARKVGKPVANGKGGKRTIGSEDGKRIMSCRGGKKVESAAEKGKRVTNGMSKKLVISG